MSISTQVSLHTQNGESGHNYVLNTHKYYDYTYPKYEIIYE